MSYAPKNFTASATLGLSDADTILTVNAAAGLTLTLPAASGSGVQYKVFVGTTVTSNSVVIRVANASDTMSGMALSCADGGSTMNGWETAADSDTITFNGSTTGGILGDHVELVDCAANKWAVMVYTSSTGTETTPFSAAVS
jgi:hypothetical protein